MLAHPTYTQAWGWFCDVVFSLLSAVLRASKIQSVDLEPQILRVTVNFFDYRSCQAEISPTEKVIL